MGGRESETRGRKGRECEEGGRETGLGVSKKLIGMKIVKQTAIAVPFCVFHFLCLAYGFET